MLSSCQKGLVKERKREEEGKKASEIGAARLRCASREGQVPRPCPIDELIEEAHPARIIWAFVEGLDLSEFYDQVKSVQGKPGSPAIDARLLMGLWL